MDVFTMVTVIVAVSCLAGVINNYLKTERMRNKSAAVDDNLLAELDALRERIEVLEKIVTDDKYDLSRQINDLERRA